MYKGPLYGLQQIFSIKYKVVLFKLIDKTKLSKLTDSIYKNLLKNNVNVEITQQQYFHHEII